MNLVPLSRLLSSLLALLLVGVAATATPAHAQDLGVVINLVITSATVDRQANTVSVTGSVQCSEPSASTVYVLVTQQIGRSAPVSGYDGTTLLDCGPTAMEFTLTAAAQTGTFRPGPAHLEGGAFTFGCVEWGCFPRGEAVPIDTTVHLRPAH